MIENNCELRFPLRGKLKFSSSLGPRGGKWARGARPCRACSRKKSGRKSPAFIFENNNCINIQS